MSWRDDDKHLQIYRERLSSAMTEAQRLAVEFESIKDQVSRILAEGDKYSPRREKFDTVLYRCDVAITHVGPLKHLRFNGEP